MKKINKKLIHFTFDIDWAPDESIDKIREILNKKNIKATFFVTHTTDILKDLKNDGHEIGIHPNFNKNSSHGSTIEKIIEHLLNIVPDARALRTHSLVQSSTLLHQIFSKYPQLKYDLSIFMHNFPLVSPFNWLSEDVKFTRINYNWEDDSAFYQNEFSWYKPYFPGNLSIYDFHPIHIHLNSNSNIQYIKLKNELNGPLFKAKNDLILKYLNLGGGVNTFFKSLVESSALTLNFNEICE